VRMARWWSRWTSRIAERCGRSMTQGCAAWPLCSCTATATPHTKAAAELAREMGFTQVSTSHETSPMMKFVSRGDTTVVDAYLSPILRRYVEQVAGEMPGVKLFFMQSSGGLTDAHAFQGKDAILSGPAGGIVGMARTAELAGH
jgi:5-oxoprolinase (ATP-hydrolysing)